MATITAPQRGRDPRDDGGAGGSGSALGLAGRLARVPTWLWAGGGLVGLMALSAFLRSRYLSGQFWMDEGITTGISLHPLGQIPHVLRYDGNPPLYYMLLHVWMSWFGDSEAATHSLSLLFGVLTIPVGGWAGWRLFGRRAGIMAALLFAFDAWLTAYAQETRMYELMALFGVVGAVAFQLGFVHRRRRFLVLFAAMLAAMLYTHTWGVFFFVGSAIAVLPVLIAAEDRRTLLRDAVITFVGAGVLYLPWVPTLLFQAAHTAAPWDPRPGFGTPVLLSRQVIGGDRITMILILPAAIGLAPLFTRAHRRSREWTVLWSLLTMIVATLAVAWIESQVNPAYVTRYFAPIIPALLLLIAWGCARARLLGLVGVALAIAFLANPSTYAPRYKSDMRDIAGEMAPQLRPGDEVVVGQPEQTPLAWYYLPAGLRWANTAGAVGDPRYMDWVGALHRLTDTNPARSLAGLVNGLAPGQRLLFIRPLTEGAQNWEASWTMMVRRRSAQWGQALTRDVAAGTLRVVSWAPHWYNNSTTVGNSAVLYQKVG